MNPFEQKKVNVEDGIRDWNSVYPKAYDKMTVDPYTKVRIILMNGIEVESVMFKHQFHRNCNNNDVRRDLALTRRVEQQQQKRINWLKPIDETALETTIGYHPNASPLKIITEQLANKANILRNNRKSCEMNQHLFKKL